jgi:hypothetical protein
MEMDAMRSEVYSLRGIIPHAVQGAALLVEEIQEQLREEKI